MYEVKLYYKPFLFMIDVVGSVLFFFNKLKSMPRKPKRVLVIRLDHIGDMVMTTPVFANLKREFPEAEICVLCRKLTQPIISDNKDVDRVIAIEPPWWSRGERMSYWQLVCFVISLRKERFDIVFELHADPRNIFLARLIGGFAIGYGIRGFGFLLNKVIPFAQRHGIDRNNAILRELGIPTPFRKTKVSVKKEERDFVNNFLSQNNIKNYIVINPGAGREEKKWNNWKELCKILSTKTTIILTGSAEEKEMCNAIIESIAVINMCGMTTLGQLCALIDRAQLVIAPDTAVIHIAHALNRPLVQLFGPTHPKHWGYTSKREIVVSKCIECPTCNNPECYSEAHRMDCMKMISVEDVINAVNLVAF